jgi:hypothetical protein
MRRASKRSRNSFMTASPSQLARGWNLHRPRESAVGHEKVTVGMPLDQIAARRDGHDDAGPSVRAELSPRVLGDGLGGALREVEQELTPLAEDPAQEARHGEDDMTMRNGLEHLPLEPFRPQELALLLARRAEGPAAT